MAAQVHGIRQYVDEHVFAVRLFVRERPASARGWVLEVGEMVARDG